jgi:hypothetical protein
MYGRSRFWRAFSDGLSISLSEIPHDQENVASREEEGQQARRFLCWKGRSCL